MKFDGIEIVMNDTLEQSVCNHIVGYEREDDEAARVVARSMRRRTRPGYMWWKDEQDLGLRN